MLTTLGKVKKTLGIEDTESDDILTSLILAASQVIESYCKRTFAKTTYIDEVYDGTVQGDLSLRNYPIISISSLSSYDTEITDYEKTNDFGLLHRKYGWNFGKRNIKVSYTAGYEIIPEAIETACNFFVKSLFYDELGKESERLGDHSITYSIDDGLPFVTKMLINPYKRVLV